MIRLGQPEAADPFASRHPRQIFLALRLAAELPDRVHDEARLPPHRRTIGAVDALDFAADQPIADIADAGAAVSLDRRPKKAELTHLVHDLAVEPLLAVCRQ